MEVLQPSLSCFSHIPPFLASCKVFDHIFGIRLGALELCYILVLSMYPPGLVENESYELTFTLTRCVVIVSYIYLVTFKLMLHWTSPCLLLPLLLSFLCQSGYVLLGGVGCHSRRLFRWFKELRISLCSYTALATLITCVMVILQHPCVMVILQHPNHRDSLILFPGNLPGPSIRHTFWERIEAPLPPLRPRCNFIHPRQLSPFPERLELPCRSMQSCQAKRILSPQEQITLLCGSRWTLTRSWYIMWLIFKKLLQTFARHQKGGLLHVLRQTVPVNIFVLVHLYRGAAASTTGTLGPDAEKKMPSKSRLRAGGMSLPCRRHLSMSIKTFLQVEST